ncbi:MAG: choice-of-anchor Q domain-containing protein [Chloroflexota bacterium]
MSTTIMLTRGELPVTKTLTIAGRDTRSVTVTGDPRRIVNRANIVALGIVLLNVTGGWLNMRSGGRILLDDGATLAVSQSAICGNFVVAGDGGAMYARPSSSVVAINSTIANNTANGSGGIHFASNATLSGLNLTIAGNSAGTGGGIANLVTLTPKNTIVANQAAGDNCSGTTAAASSADNLQDSASASCSAAFAASGSVNLGPLADNGGATRTHALLSGSAARMSTALIPRVSAKLSARAIAPSRYNCAPKSANGRRPVARGGSGGDMGHRLDWYRACGRGLTALASALALWLAGPTRAEAATFTVNLTGDAGDGTCDGTCTLRDAILTANANGDSSNVINFSPAVVGTVTLGGTQLTISKSLTVNGPGASLLTVSGANLSRVINVTAGTISISGLTITGGSGDASGGGGILTAPAVTLTVANSLISGNASAGSGGGIANAGTLNLTNSTISGNGAAVFGGGITNAGTLTATNSTVSGNSLAITGGGIFTNGTLTLTNTTVTGNSAGSGGGIYAAGGTLTLKNTIVANQTTGNNCAGTTAGAGSTNNLQDSGTSCGTGFSINAATNLGTLQNNGGPTTTHALLAGSAALNAGSNTACPDTDQRGAPRAKTAGDPCDVGAFEQATFVVTKTADTADGACSVADCSLREAIAAAGNGDVISFAPTVTGTITLGGTELTISHSIAINGPSAASLTISGGHASRVFAVASVTVSISNLTITGGNNSAGGGILNSGMLTLTNDTISGNSGGDGGGIFSVGPLTLKNSTVSDNAASGDGGGIFSDATLTLVNSTVSGNTGGLKGGGIYNGDALTATNATISRNSAVLSGGIYTDGGTMTLKNTIVANQIAGPNCFGTAGAGSTNNLQDSGTSCGTGFTINAATNLGPLQNNGGPTATRALLAGSVALNAGHDATCAALSPSTDQRGKPRIIDTHCDIGAFEADTVDLAVTLTDNRSSLSPGQSISFTALITNAGPLTAASATVSVPLPAGLLGPTWTCSGASGATCGAPSGSGSIGTTATIPTGGSVTYVITGSTATGAAARVTGTDAGTLTVTASAAVAPAQQLIDSNPANNAVSDASLLVPPSRGGPAGSPPGAPKPTNRGSTPGGGPPAVPPAHRP